ncbi:MAG: FliA/WhiG family RNA polymerase sigma factor [Verrucomicrobiota bacterium]
MYAEHPISDPSTIDTQTFDRNALISQHYPLVRSIVNSMLAHLPACADADELHSVGVTGLIAAVDRYKPEHAATFRSYAGTRIRGAILDELRRMDALPRTRRAKVRRMRETVEKLEQQYGRAPTDTEIAKSLNLSPKQYDRFRQGAEPVHFVSLDQSHRSANEDEPNLHETIADDRAEPVFDKMEHNELVKEVIEMIQDLPERQRSILIQYYYEGKRLAEIAETYGVTEARICQIHTQAVAKLRRALNSAATVSA